MYPIVYLKRFFFSKMLPKVCTKSRELSFKNAIFLVLQGGASTLRHLPVHASTNVVLVLHFGHCLHNIPPLPGRGECCIFFLNIYFLSISWYYTHCIPLISVYCPYHHIMLSMKALNYGTRFTLYCVSQKEVIKILTPCCSKNDKNLTILVCWTKCSSLLDVCFKYQKNSLIIA